MMLYEFGTLLVTFVEENELILKGLSFMVSLVILEIKRFCQKYISLFYFFKQLNLTHITKKDSSQYKEEYNHKRDDKAKK